MARKNRAAPAPPSQEDEAAALALVAEAMALMGEEPPADEQVQTTPQADESVAALPAAEAGTVAEPPPAMVETPAAAVQQAAVSPLEAKEDLVPAPEPETAPTPNRWKSVVRRGLSTNATEGTPADNPAPAGVIVIEVVEHQPPPQPQGSGNAPEGGSPIMPTKTIKTKAGNINIDEHGVVDTKKVDKKIRSLRKEAGRTKLVSWTGLAVGTGIAAASAYIGMEVGFAQGKQAAKADAEPGNVTNIKTGTRP